MTSIDLTNCDREPIHIPGKVQEHGVLIAIDKDFKIAYCSENIALLFPVTAAMLLGEPVSYLSPFLLTEVDNFIESLLIIAQANNAFEPVNPYPVTIGNVPYHMILSTAGAYYLAEFEPASSDLEKDLQQVIGSSLSIMLGDAKLNSLLYKTAQQISKIIRYDRVMVYKFHDDGHGEVVAEAKNENIEPLMGLHYPASDIPKQARELYKLNLTRLIADVEAAASLQLREAFDNHLIETEGHVQRLEQIFRVLGLEPDTTKCDAMDGIVDEGEEIISDTEDGTATRDVGLIFAGQKAEHYEIASYGGMVSLAKTLGYHQIADLLILTLNEEKAADDLLTKIAENNINYQASGEQKEKGFFS
jgi:ferritin-like metal-binding protein YciE